MAIEVIRREVEEHRRPRVERVDRFQLEAARFDDVDGVGRRLIDLRAQRVPDVAADEDLEAARLEHPPGKGRRRRLSLRSSDGDDSATNPSRGELELADDGDAGAPRGIDSRV